MKKIFTLIVSVTILVFAIVTNSSATHLMGGSLNYEYLGLNTTTGLYEYKVSITIYRYCEPGSSTLPTSMELGIYQDDPGNPSGDKLLVATTSVPLITIQSIVPPNANDTCTFTPSVCVEEGYYEVIVSLPASSSGYYFISDRCCRNNNILNLQNPGNLGQAYFASAPDPVIVNSSPTFAQAPVPFICANDSVSILNQAYDPDGDSLVYSFVVPYNGISTGGNPNPNPPVTYPWTIPEVNYAGGYSLAAPFGPGGSATINPSTGLATYYATNQGFYVLAVEISEYRNGVLIGVTRRDLQIIVIPCPVNPAPVLSSSTSQVTYTIIEGQTLCFSVEFNDPNNDSIFVTHAGNIFDSTFVNPAATFIDSSGAGTATGNFCWTTSCDQGQSTPYQFSVAATDNGCPAKVTNIVYTINVTNTLAPASMTGPDTLCVNAATGIQYTVPASTGNTFNWFVTNGNITGPQNGTSVNVNFTAPGMATIGVTTVNPNGCVSDTLLKDVYIVPLPAAVAGPDVAICSGQTTSLGGPSSPGYIYSWTPSTGLSNDSVSNPTVTLTNNGAGPITNTYILTVNLDGCINVDTVTVTVNPNPGPAAGPDVSLCSGSSTPIGTTPVGGQVYSWSPATGLSSTTIANPTVTLINVSGTTDTVVYVLQVQNSFGCSGSDTMIVFVYPAPVADAGTDVSFCGGLSATIGVGAVPGYTYSWSPATGLSSVTSGNPVVSLNNTSLVPDTIWYVVTATLGNCNDVDSVMVVVQPSPVSNAGPDQLLCSGLTLQLGTTSTPGYVYSWSPATGLSGTTVSNPTLTISNPGTTPDTLVYGVTTTLNGCTTTDSVMIISGPAPLADAGTDVIFCSGQTAAMGTAGVTGYTYSWSPATGLNNPTDASTNVTLTNSSGVNDTIYYIVSVNAYGCTDSDTVMVIVKPLPLSNAGPNQLLCSGGSVQLGTASTPGYVYSWSPATGLSGTTVSNPTLTISNPGTTPDTLVYVVTTTLNGCTTTDSVMIISGPAPLADAGTDVIFCSGQTAAIGTAGVTGYTYSWSPATGLNNPTDASTNVTLTNSSGVNDTIYYIVSVNAYGCTDSDTVMVIVKPLPLSNAGPNQLLCSGGSVQLGTASTPGYVYSWSPATGLSGTTVSDPTLTLTNPGTTPDTLVYVVTTSLNGCTTTDSVMIISGPAPVADAGTDVIFCSGQTAAIGTAGVTGYTYSWSPATGLNNPTDASTNVTLTNSSGVNDTIYYIVSVNAYGCTDSDTVMVVVKPLPLSEAGNATTLCGGDTLVLGTSSTPGYTYSWSPVTGLNNGTISNPVLIIPNNGSNPIVNTYTVTTTLNGCTTSDSVTITINPEPVVAATANPVAICLGASSTLGASGAQTYSWALITAPQTPIGTGGSLTVTPTITTSYIVTGSNGFACSDQDTITVTVNPLPSVLIAAANDTICDGDTLLLSASGASVYTWSVPGTGIIGTGSSISVTPSVTTTYIVNATDTNLCAGADTITIVVNPAPTVNTIYGNISVCPSVMGVPYWIANPNPTSTYVWSVTNGVIASGQGTDSITVDWGSTSGTGTVSIIEITNLGCASPVPVTLTVSINVILTPIAPTGPDVLCANEAQGMIYTTLNTPGSTYNWNALGGVIVGGNGTSTVTVDWNVTGPQTVYLWYDETSTTITNVCFGTSDTLAITINPAPNTSAISGPASICIGDTGTFSVTNTSGSGYVWSVNGGSLVSGNGTSSVVVAWPASGSGSVSVVETNSYGCTGDTVTIPVTINPLPAANAGPDVGVCIGQTVQLNASGGVIYFWSPPTGLSNISVSNPLAGPAVSTQYTVLVTDVNGCKNSDSVLVTVHPLPVITITPASSVCYGSSIQLNAGGGVSYQWSPGTTLDNPGIASPTASPLVNTTYSVVVTDQNGCVDSASVNITVNPLPTAVAGADTLICEGSSAYLSASGGVSYSWSPAGSLNNSNISNPVATPSSPTVYTVIVTDQNGCTDDDQVEITLNDQPEASFVVDESVISASCNGIIATLINTSQDALNIQWMFPDGTTGTDDVITYHFDFNNTLITLIAYNNICSDTMTLNYAGALLDNVFNDISNVFSPNGDGMNDCFDLGTKYDFKECSTIHIFNRWGEKVFSATASNPCWNGRKDGTGADMPSGTYYLTVSITGHQYKGTVTLIR